ncbi:MAG: protoporphyrinogen oxidase [Myxococcales bacterium]|nr:protoporphyrinogen oxidase [Myxococcales bacterium]
MFHLLVVGGGITGLSAAYAALGRARELGTDVRVTVLERQARLGGSMITERHEGFVLDGGPDSWVANKREATELARELGLERSLVTTNAQNRRYDVVWKGKLHPVPAGLVLGVPTQLWPLVRTGLFSWRAKLRMALEPFVPARRFESEDDDESIADFAARRLGREAAERLVAPLLGGITAADASDVSVRAAFPQLCAMEREHGSLIRGMRAAAKERRARAAAGRDPGPFVSLEGGVGQLVAALADKVREGGASVRLGVAARSLRREGARWAVDLADGERLSPADAVVLAVPAHAAARICSGVDAELVRALSAIPYTSTATAFLAFRREDVAHPLGGMGFVVPRNAGRALLAATWVSSKWDGRAPEGHVLLRAFFGGVGREEILAGGDDALVSRARDELRALMGIDPQPLWSRVFRFEAARAQMRVGHLAAMRDLRRRLAEVAPGVLVAGDGFDGAGIPDAIRQGRSAGRELVARAPRAALQNSAGSL